MRGFNHTTGNIKKLGFKFVRKWFHSGMMQPGHLLGPPTFSLPSTSHVSTVRLVKLFCLLYHFDHHVQSFGLEIVTT
jgi:hypothetical protein